ncbi:MAG: TIGR03936 family radical SAM-associated protein [Eubacterium sp.]|nr:TIGR03936 family radical SAM-associated protein [Eubacterium sp.]
MNTIRFKFKRDERLRFISHLDQQRLFQRAFRRAGLPMAHSNGFNPHPRLSFALAMSVGLTSDAEYGEVILTEAVDLKDFVKQLNGALPQGLSVTEAWEERGKAPSLSASLTDSVFAVKAELAREMSDGELTAILQAYLAQDEIILNKRNKKGKLVAKNIRPFIKNIEVVSAACQAELNLSLAYIDQQSVKPELVLQTVNDTQGEIFVIDPTLRLHRRALNLEQF